MARSSYMPELSYSAASYDSNATAGGSGVGFCWKQFCCALLCFILLIALAAMIYVVVDGNHETERSTSKTSSSHGGRNPTTGGKDGAVRSFNWCGQHKRKFVLTFDDGPSVEGTPNVLADLKKIGAKGTFFVSPAVNGEPDSAQCALVEKILAEGHQIKLHSFKHDDYMKKVDVEVTSDLKKTKDWVTKCAGGQADKLRIDMFRPPYGSLDYTRAKFISNELGYTIATWNIDTQDFHGGNATVLHERINEQFAQLIPDGEGSVVLLMHDKTYTSSGSMGLLPLLKATYVDKKGYEMILADDCYKDCDPKLSSCKMQGVWPGCYEQP